MNRKINEIATTSGKLLLTLLTIAGTNLIFSENRCVNAAPISPIAAEPELEIDVTGNRRLNLPTSSPIYTIESQQIEQQGSKNVADVLKNLPGFAVNDVGYGADIHTGTYYRGASTNQFIILLNGRPIGTNISTYHGATDLNSIPAGEPTDYISTIPYMAGSPIQTSNQKQVQIGLLDSISPLVPKLQVRLHTLAVVSTIA